MKLVRRWRQDRKGATAIEYSLLAAMFALIAIGGFSGFASAIKQMYENNSNRVIESFKP